MPDGVKYKACIKLGRFLPDCEDLDSFLCKNKRRIISSDKLMMGLFNQYKNYLYKSARKIINRYPNIEIDELISEGFEGILRALDKYDCNESSFLTYAQYWIRMKMLGAARKSIGVISLPGGMYSVISKVKQELDINPEAHHSDIAIKISESPERVAIALNLIKSPKSGGTESLEDFVTYEDSLNAQPEKLLDDDYSERDFKNRFWHIVEQTVTPKECFVLGLLFGRDGDMRRSLEWVAKVLYVSKERIRQIRVSACNKLRASEAMLEFVRQE